MRTTITLDDDVARTVREEMTAGKGKSFKDAVNELIRLGYHFKKQSFSGKEKKPFKVKSFNMGVYEHLNYDNIGELLDEIEGPFHR
jgi:hypothetical protein